MVPAMYIVSTAGKGWKERAEMKSTAIWEEGLRLFYSEYYSVSLW